MAGYVQVDTDLAQAATLTLRFAEHLDERGEIDLAAIQVRPNKATATPKQTIQLAIPAGHQHYKTKFAVFGFRYAAVSADYDPEQMQVTAIAVYSDMAVTGTFTCSNPLINQFVTNTLWSMKSNCLDVPTDCPTRERAPWTGDVQIFARTGAYLMDTSAFMRKWLVDLRDRQAPNGKVPCHAPDVRNNEFFWGIDFIKRMDGCCGWADAAVLVPWQMYRMYQDRRFLEAAYASMKRHVQFQISRTNKTGLFGKPFTGPNKKYVSNVGQAFGEWLEPKDTYHQSVIKDFCAPHPEEATAYLAYVCGIMVKVSELLNKPEDTPLYREYYAGCKRAYVEQFLPVPQRDRKRQSKYVRPLALGLVDDPSLQQALLAQLASLIVKRNYTIGTGFLSTPLILPLLSRYHRDDLAYRLLENEQMPGWLYEVKQGATTVWEEWDGTSSQNHYSPGSACQWLFETVGGIQVTGENQFTIQPIAGGQLTQATCSYQSAFGKVSCAWQKSPAGLVYDLAIPANTQALFIFPDGRKQRLSGGRAYHLQYRDRSTDDVAK